MKRHRPNRQCFQYVQKREPTENVDLAVGGEMKVGEAVPNQELHRYMCPECGRLVRTLQCNGVCRLCEPTSLLPLLLFPRTLFFWLWRWWRQRKYDDVTGGFTYWLPREYFTPSYVKPDTGRHGRHDRYFELANDPTSPVGESTK